MQETSLLQLFHRPIIARSARDRCLRPIKKLLQPFARRPTPAGKPSSAVASVRSAVPCRISPSRNSPVTLTSERPPVKLIHAVGDSNTLVRTPDPTFTECWPCRGPSRPRLVARTASSMYTKSRLSWPSSKTISGRLVRAKKWRRLPESRYTGSSAIGPDP